MRLDVELFGDEMKVQDDIDSIRNQRRAQAKQGKPSERQQA
jgi:hypothetical protein